MFITSLYVPKNDIPLLEDIERLAIAKKFSKNQMIMFIIRDWIENHKSYVDRKITDFEVQSVLSVKQSIRLDYCDECGCSFQDEQGYIIHHPECSWSINVKSKSK